MKKIKRIMVLLVMLALSISAFVLPARSGMVYANVSDLTDTIWTLKQTAVLPNSSIKYNVVVGFENDEWSSDGLWLNVNRIGTEPGGTDIVWSLGDSPITMHFISGTDITNSDLIDWLYLNADLQCDEPEQTGVVTDIVIPVVLALVVGTIIAFVVMDSKKVFVK